METCECDRVNLNLLSVSSTTCHMDSPEEREREGERERERGGGREKEGGRDSNS